MAPNTVTQHEKSLLCCFRVFIENEPPCQVSGDSQATRVWVSLQNIESVAPFLRVGTDGSIIACVANFSPVPHERYQLGLPKAGRWEEVVNTDAEVYFGSGVGNFGGVEAGDQVWHGQPASVTLRIPPLGAIWLRWIQ
jgi:1,4-alpha-glucan branching enzyme